MHDHCCLPFHQNLVTKHVFQQCITVANLLGQDSVSCTCSRCQLPAVLPCKLLTLSLVYPRSNGNINELAEDNKQHVKLFNCNFDFTYAEHFHTARFGPGAFIHLLDVLFHESTGQHIEIIRHGEFITLSCNFATLLTPFKSVVPCQLCSLSPRPEGPG